MNLTLWVISKAHFDHDGVGYSKLMEHFPYEIGPDVFYDTLTNLRKPWGRDPTTGDPLLVTTVDRYTSTITTPGIMAQTARITPGVDTVPAVCVTEAKVYDFDVAQAIHTHLQHLVLALEVVDPEDDPPIAGWGKDDTFTAQLWTQVRDGLVALGVEAEVVDGWRDDNPTASRREFYNALKTFINQQGA